MNPTKLSALAACALFAAAGTHTNLNAAIDIADPATYYAAENWYGYRSNADVVYTVTESSINFSKIDSSSYVWAYFSPVQLSLGQSVTFSGTATAGTIASGGVFSVGLFNSGRCGESEMATHCYQSSTDVSGMANYANATSVIGAATGGMTGVSANNEKAYLRTKSTSNTAFLSTASGAQQATLAFEPAFAAPVAGSSYDFYFEAEKTETGLNLTVSFGGIPESQTLAVETEIDVFDVIGLRSPVTAGGNGITLTNLSITTTGTIIPEPSAFGLMGGGLFLALALCSRRRRKGKA